MEMSMNFISSSWGGDVIFLVLRDACGVLCFLLERGQRLPVGVICSPWNCLTTILRGNKVHWVQIFGCEDGQALLRGRGKVQTNAERLS